jgi:Rad3-related DNA helicase
VNRIRRAAQRAHLIIVNHSLVFSDMVSEGSVLGEYARIVFDEAHNLEKVAMRYLGVTLAYSRVRRILNRLHTKSEGSHGILAVLEAWVGEMVKGWPEYEAHRSLIDEAVERVQAVRSQSQDFFQCIHAAVTSAAADGGEGSHEGKLRYFAESPVFIGNSETVNEFRGGLTGLIETMGHVFTALSPVSSHLLPHKEETLIDIEKTQADLLAVVADLDFLVAASGRNVFWFEYDEGESAFSLRIQSAPLDVNEKLAAGLYDHMETVIMTSATLAVVNDFSYIRDRLGLNLDSRDRVTEFIASSPFDYHHQAAIVVPTFLPSPKDGEFILKANEVILSLAAEVGRGMLVLFTSRGHLQRSFTDLRDEFARRGITLLAQGVDGSRNMLLRRFREDVSSVLFGTDSFWEGVDVPGKALEIVVIVRLPFSVPTDPIVQAQMEEVERTGRNPFTGYSVPEAAIKLRQGAGRLIRHRTDRGAVVILDSRMVTARYGATFRRSLQGKTLKADSTPMLVESLKRWFEENNGE